MCDIYYISTKTTMGIRYFWFDEHKEEWRKINRNNIYSFMKMYMKVDFLSDMLLIKIIQENSKISYTFLKEWEIQGRTIFTIITQAICRKS